MTRPRTFDENEVLEGAVEAFRELGYEGTSIPELTSRLGICRQSLYNAFGDKRSLFLAAITRYGEREIDGKLALLEAEGSPLDNTRTVVRGWAALATQCPGDGCLLVGAIHDTADDPEARAIVEAQVERLEQGFRAALERARAAGELRPSASPTRLARTLVSLGYGVALMSRLEGSGPRIGDAVATMLAFLDAAEAGD